MLSVSFALDIVAGRHLLVCIICCVFMHVPYVSMAVFNVGEYRRKITGSETVTADFFHPTNDDARRIRELVDLVFLHTFISTPF